MKPPCIIVVTYVLPAIRAIISRKLIEQYSLKPSKVANRMGVTAAAVTQYEKSRRGAPFIKALNCSSKAVEAIDDLVDSIKGEEHSVDDLIRKLCDLCATIRSEKLICGLHSDKLGALKELKCEICEEI